MQRLIDAGKHPVDEEDRVSYVFACRHEGQGVSALVGPTSRSGSVSPDAVNHPNSDTDARGRSPRAFHRTRFRVRATRTASVRVLVRVGVRVGVRILILVLFW